MRGVGPDKPDIMVLLDCPGFTDDEAGEPAQGDSGAKLRYLLKHAGINRHNVFITNAIKCRPWKPDQIKPIHLKACQGHLAREIVKHKPKVIIAAGTKAVAMLLHEKSTGDIRGHFIDVEFEDGFRTWVVPTYGMNACLAKWEFDELVIHDMTKARVFVETGELPKPLDVDVELVLDKPSLLAAKAELLAAKEFSFDFETTGLKFHTDKIVLAGFSPKPGRSIVIPYFVYDMAVHAKKWDEENKAVGEQINAFVSANKKLIEETLREIFVSDVPKSAHNGKFDAKFATFNGFPVKNFTFDTVIAHSLIDENKQHDLTFCSEWFGINHFLDGALIPYERALWPFVNKTKGKQKPYSFVPPLVLAGYLGKDTDGTLRLKRILRKRLDEEGMTELFKRQQMPLTRLMAEMELTGIKVDVQQLQDISKRFAKRLAFLEKRLKKVTRNKTFNPKSWQQVLEHLEEIGAPLVKKTKGGAFSTDESVLSELAGTRRFGKVPRLLLEHREITKLKGTYLDGKDGLSGMLAHVGPTGRVHATWNIHTPRTGRMSSNEPNMQNIPRPNPKYPWANIRTLFKPTRKGWVMFSVDYKQLEMRVAAAISQDKIMCKEIRDGVDLHTRNVVMFGKVLGFLPADMTEEKFAKIRAYKKPDNYDQLSKKEKDAVDALVFKAGEYDEFRVFAKSLGFGVNYGMEASTLAKEHDMEVDEVQEALDLYFKKYEGLALWREEQCAASLKDGVLVLPETGRKRRFYGAKKWFDSRFSADTRKREMDISGVHRQAMNFPIQGFANEVFTQGKLEFRKALRKKHMKSRLLLSLHDGVLGEGPISEMKMVERLAKACMERSLGEGKFALPLLIDFDLYESWSGKKVKVEDGKQPAA